MSFNLNQLYTRPSLALLCGMFFSLLITVILFSSYDAHSDPLPKTITDGFYSLNAPIIISHSPLVSITKGKVRLIDLKKNEKSLPLIGFLPSEWIKLFVVQKLSNIELTDAKITVDFRRMDIRASDKSNQSNTESLISSSLKKSYLETILIKNSSLTIYRDYNKPTEALISNCELEVDLDDGEIDGSGNLLLNKLITSFTLSHDFSNKNDKGIVLNQINLSLKNTIFSSEIDGVLYGRSGLHFKGDVELDIKDTNALNLLNNAGGQVTESKDFIHFLAAGLLNWSDSQGTLSNGKFKFGNNSATGTLSLKVSQANPEISGTLAFNNLDFSNFKTATRRPKLSKPDVSDRNFNDYLFEKAKNIYPLIRNYDADLRVSAGLIKIHEFELQDSGFSLFQKKGELLIDMAGISLFKGTATGLLKIDTNSPKPRWHINTGFKNIELAELSLALKSPAFLSGLGDLKIQLTSFGDKGTEIYENMFGSLSFAMPNGGEVALSLNEFLGEQKLDSEKTFKKLQSGKTPFVSLKAESHFSKGAMIMDHLLVSIENNDLTSRGFINLKSNVMDLHVASWETVTEPEEDTSTSKGTDKRTQNEKQRVDPHLGLIDTTQNKIKLSPTPILLTCTHIYGAWSELILNKLTALHLSLLNRGCPVNYHYDPLKTKDNPIVPTDNAG